MKNNNANYYLLLLIFTLLFIILFTLLFIILFTLLGHYAKQITLLFYHYYYSHYLVITRNKLHALIVQ